MMFRIVDGVAVPFPEAEGRHVMLLQERLAGVELGPFVPRSKRERRRMARSGMRGRRRARRVLPVGFVPRYEPMSPPLRLDAHRLSDGRRDVLLYLPAGHTPTAEHCAAVERAIQEET
jgi:hypothetical protein